MNNIVLRESGLVVKEITNTTYDYSKLKWKFVVIEKFFSYVTESFTFPSSVCGYGLEETEDQGKEYDEKDIELILDLISTLCIYYNPPVQALEVLCRALGPSVAKQFYASYGYMGSKYLAAYCKVLKTTPLEQWYFPDEELPQPIYYGQSGKLSVYGLLHSLVSDQAKIFTDPEIVGTYSRIGMSKKERPKEVTIEDSRWQPILGLVGNKRRANLSVQFRSYITVEVPENDKGADPGPRTLEAFRTFNIIRDGVLNTRYLAVIVSSELAEKLKDSGCVEGSVIFKNSLLLDLSQLPIILQTEIGDNLMEELGKTEIDLYKNKIKLSYVNYGVKPAKTTKKSSASSPQEQYLNSLGIFGNSYYPVNEKLVNEGESYEVLEYTPKILKVNVNPESYIGDFLKTGSCKNPNILGFLKFMAVLDKDNLLEEKELLMEKYRDLVLRAILSKVFYHNEKYKDQGTRLEVEWKEVWIKHHI